MNIEETYKRVFDHVKDALFLIDLHHTEEGIEFVYSRVNEACRKRSGLDNETMTGHTPGEVFDKPVAGEVTENYLRCVEQRNPIEYVEHLDTPSGGDIWRTKLTPLIEDGRVESILGTTQDITERKEIEQERTRFKKSVDASAHGVFITDTEGIITYANPAFAELTGYTRSELRGRNPRILKSGEHDASDYRELWDTIKSGEVWRGEVVNRRKNGDLFTVMQTISPVYDEDGELDGFIAVQNDITEKKKQEQELRLKNRAIEDSPIGITMSDARLVDNPICYLNDGFTSLTGYSREEVMGENCRFLQGEETDPQVVDRIRQAIDREEMVEEEIRNYRADGEMFWNHLIITPIRNEVGEVTHYIGYQQDVTTRKKMETSLRKRERLYRTLFEEASEGFLIESLDDQVLDANKAAGELLGYRVETLKGMDLKELIPEKIIEECGEKGIVQHHLNKHGTDLYQGYYLHRDGTTVPVEKSKTPIEYDGKKAVLICARDRTKLERLRQKDERKSTVVSQVTHDLRTPLNAIIGMGSLLLNTDLSGEQQNYLQTILNAGRNMERLTDDILDLNRIERGEFTLNQKPFQIQRILGEVISLYGQKLDEQEVTLSTQVAPDVPDQLVGDPDRLKQILHNLIDNAIKHTKEGSITMQCALEARSDHLVTLSWSVQDTGEGIPESELAEIFKQHKQVLNDRSDAEEGLGLGLSICKNLVELMNGQIDVTSNEGEGTTFTFTAEFREHEASGTNGPVSLKNSRVLLAEDNSILRQLFCKYLETNEVEVEGCSTGEEALEVLEATDRDEFDAVFLDNRMDGMSGVDVLETVAADEQGMNPERVYMLTGDTETELNNQIDVLSYGGILEKPIDESTLIECVSSAVQSRGEGEDENDISGLQEQIRGLQADPLHILVAEDDQNTRTLLQELLSPVSDEILYSTNGEETIRKRFEQSPDLILMDVEMPVMNGLDATKVIREQEEENHIAPVPIIIQTAKAMEHIEQESSEAEADGFLRKPIKKRALYRAILDVLE